MTDTLIVPLRFTPPTAGGNPREHFVSRPETARERLVVPGQPRALENRPANAIGRLPMGVNSPLVTEEAKDALPFDIDAIQREVENSEEYQALKGAGYIRENPLRKERPSLHQPAQGDIEEKLKTDRRTPAFPPQASTSRETLENQTRRAAQEAEPERSDPLALDLDGDGLETTGISNGVRFDINADGRLDQTSFITGGDAFLALDANGNGRIDDGRELFGDQNGDANGYLALARYDDNSDGQIDHEDAVFQQLRLFTQGRDGSQQLRTLDEAGIASLSLAYRNSSVALNQYDSISQLSSFEREDGSTGSSGDLFLGYKSPG
jgi:hypothetical protein